jgi:hypothetical protein
MAGVGFRWLKAMGRLVLLLLALCALGAQGLYFHIGETEKRCFIPDETMVIGNYRTQMWDKQKEVFLPSTPGLGMHVEVKDAMARWCCPGSMAPRAASLSPPTRPATTRSACTPTPPGWRSSLVASW